MVNNMINIFNRKELLITHSSAKKDAVLRILEFNDIKTRLVIQYRLTGSTIGEMRSRVGLLGQTKQDLNLYKIYNVI